MMATQFKQKVNVAVRVRPQQDMLDSIWVRIVDGQHLETINHRNVEESLQYEFDTVFGPTDSQQNVYSGCVKPLLQQVMNGRNASVLAYGPTGSGKTHTILGNDSQPGIIPRIMEDLFRVAQEETKNGDVKYTVSYSYLEIYNEKIQDLLDKKNTDLQIREDSQSNIFVKDLKENEIVSFDDFNKSFPAASRNRKTAATKLNTHSSRSHSILTFKVVKFLNFPPFRRLTGKMSIVDLAGCEDNRRTGNEGLRLKESGAINTSLFVLGEVVAALNINKNRIPYRDSKLTRLLQDSLGGNAHSLMIINIAPEERHYLDTHATLKLARMSTKIVNTVTLHETIEKKINRGFKNVYKTDADEEERTVIKIDRRAASVVDETSPSLESATSRRIKSTSGDRIENQLIDLQKQLAEMKAIFLKSKKPASSASLASTSKVDPTSKVTVRSQSNLDLDDMRMGIDDLENKLKDDDFPVFARPSVPVRKMTRRSSMRKSVVAEEMDDELFGSPLILPPVSRKSKRKSVLVGQVEPLEPAEKLKNDKLDELLGSPLILPVISRKSKRRSCAAPLQPCSVGPLIDKSNVDNVKCKVPKLSVDSLDDFTPGLRKSVAVICPYGQKRTSTPSKAEKENFKINPLVREEHEIEILSIINSGTAKELSSKLQSIGVKRANAVVNFRLINGPLISLKELEKIPNFPWKQFMRANYIETY